GWQESPAFRHGEYVNDAIYAAGYQSSSLVYEQVHHILGTTPTKYRDGGKGITMRYVITTCRLGYLLVAATEKGVCKISLADEIEALQADLRREFPHADISYDEQGLGEWLQPIVQYIDGETQTLNLPLDIQATSFQRKVWAALCQIPYGQTRTYQEIANMIGQPSAARAVARAIASNPTAIVIPCHRVIRSDGTLSGYRWGVERKAALLALESGDDEP
ncbi:MAG: bifunctional transcriptional activator/DNA repair enzyme protein Ada, partial [Phototrophicales bacterium]